MKKYELTSETKSEFGTTFYRIYALKDFGNVKKGSLGGWIEKEENLSQSGNAWISENAWVFGDAWVSGNARVLGNARISGDAQVYKDAWVAENAWIFGEK
jgi:hypothetical protein